MHVYLFGKNVKGALFQRTAYILHKRMAFLIHTDYTSKPVGDYASTIHPKAAKENKILVLISKKGTNRAFYSCVLSCLAFE